MYHTFDSGIAIEVGVNAAILLKNIQYWCEKNRANGRHLYDGDHWTYNSRRAFCDLFPYLTDKQIRTALEILETNGYIKTGRYNKSGYDRTKWFCPTGPIHLPSRANGDARQGQPIPDSKPDINTDSKREGRAREENIIKTKDNSKTGFLLTLDWEPDPELWEANASRSGVDPDYKEHIHEFKLFWESESKSFTEAQWQGKLIRNIKTNYQKTKFVTVNAGSEESPKISEDLHRKFSND